MTQEKSNNFRFYLAQVDALISAMDTSSSRPNTPEHIQHVSYQAFSNQFNNIVRGLNAVLGRDHFSELGKYRHHADLLVTQHKAIFDEIYTSALSLQAYLTHQVRRPDNDGHVLSSESAQHDSRKVFLVHGHDGEVKQTVARFLEKNGLNVIILDEIAGQGRTIIEKFEQHSSVGYAVVLMTPDDATERSEGGASQRRARQNVVFELGFFVGTLKRGRVCVIARGNVEKPSNYWGVEYIPWDDAGGWKLKLLEEMKAANVVVGEG